MRKIRSNKTDRLLSNVKTRPRYFMVAVLIAAGMGIIFPDSAFSKTIYANVSERTAVEPVMLVGAVEGISRNGCRIKVISETYRNDTIELNGKCPNSLRKGERVFGTFDGKNFVFMKKRGLR